jgi:hypothetical protein
MSPLSGGRVAVSRGGKISLAGCRLISSCGLADESDLGDPSKPRPASDAM